MTTIPYSDLLAQVEALAGATLATQERARVKIFANRRARAAHRECDYWPHLLYVGEEREVSDTGLLPLEQTGLQDIDKIIRIHATDPFKSEAVFEFTEYYQANGGIQITGYTANKSSDDMIVTGTLSPDVTGLYLSVGIVSGDFVGTKVSYSMNGETVTGLPPVGDDNQIFWDTAVSSWTIANYVGGELVAAWLSTDDTDTPDLASGWTLFAAATGSPTVTAQSATAFVTYLAKIPSTYGDGDGEESEVPEPWFEYMAQGAYADWLRSDGQTEKAMAEEAIAAGLLNQQLEKVSRSNGQQVITRMMSHGTKQAR